MSHSSCVEMDSEQVREMAQACLDIIHAERQAQRDELVQRYRASRWHQFWDRLLKKPERTDAEIYESLKHPDNLRLASIELLGRFPEMTARRLLRAAEYAPRVFVSAADLEEIELCE